MENSFKLKKDMNLTFTELLIYSLLSSNSDRNGVSHASREWLAAQSGIKKLDTITKHTNSLQAKGLIKKRYEFRDGKKLVIYTVLNPQHNFIWISNDVCRYKPGLVGFLIKLAELRWKRTDTVRLSANEIIRRIGMSKSTFHRYKNELIADGMLEQTDLGFRINTAYFPVFTDGRKALADYEAILISRARECPSFKCDKRYQEFYKHKKNGFADVKASLDKLPDLLESGTWFIKHIAREKTSPAVFPM